MTVSDFLNSTLGEAVDFIVARADFEHKRSGQAWKVMRWQTAIMINMMTAKGKTILPEDLFLLDDEEHPMPKIPIDSDEANRVFEEMDKKFLQRWQRQSEV